MYVALDFFEAEVKTLSIVGVLIDTDNGSEGVVGLPKRFVSTCLVFFTDAGGVLIIADADHYNNVLMSLAPRVAT